MKEYSAYIHRALLLAAFLALAGCGNSNEKSMKPATAPGAGTVVGMSACVSCHREVAAGWLAGKHGNLNSGDLNSIGAPASTEVTAGACTACHDPLGDSQRLTPGLTGNVARPVVGCESCHGGGSLHIQNGGPLGATALAAGVVGTTAVSAQFNTCTFCHELLDSAGTGTAAPAHGLASAVSPTGTQYAVTDTHFAQARATSGLFAVSGYAMDFASETVCSDCHNPHDLSVDIAAEWAQSGHADRYRSGQDPLGYFNAAWGRSDWNAASNTRCQRCHTTTGFRRYADALRAGDQATVEGMSKGDIAFASLPTTTPYKPEMLHCNACHRDNKGGLRDPGAVTAQYDVVMSYPSSTFASATYAEVHFTYPDAADSNICLTCHVGRESGDSVKQLNLQTGLPSVDFNALSFQSSHYLTAGGTVFTATGYEFAGRSYDNPASYLHNQIGMNDFRSTGTSGPCVGCHMSRPNKNGDHLFLPVSRFNRVRNNTGTVTVANGSATVTGSGTSWTTAGVDTAADRFLGPDGRAYRIGAVVSDTQLTLSTAYTGTGTSQAGANKNYVIAREGLRITGIASELCFNCHAGTTAALADQLNEGRELFEQGLRALEHALDKKGFCFFDSNVQLPRYSAGTVTATQGSAVVTGIGTAFNGAGISAGNDATSTDKFRIYDGDEYDILSVDGDTQITLKSPFLGASVAAPGAPYMILRSGSSNRVSDWTGADNDATGATSGKNTMGAAFNLNLLEHDPGAYVHNRTYVKRLIYDSLDWTDDGLMNYSVGATLNALGSEPYKTKAMQYLLPNGILGIAAERP